MSEIQKSMILGEIWRILVVEDITNADEIHAQLKEVFNRNITA